MMEAAMTSDPGLVLQACNLLYGFYNRTGQRDKLRPLENRVDQFNRVAALAQAERARVSAADAFMAHGLPPEKIEELRKICRAEPDIFAAAVARKVVTHFPERPLYVPALHVKTGRGGSRAERRRTGPLFNASSSRCACPNAIVFGPGRKLTCSA